MGTIRSHQLAVEYRSQSADPARRCERCAYQTWAANTRGNRLPYCQMGGFFVWLDSGCAKWLAREAGRHG